MKKCIIIFVLILSLVWSQTCLTFALSKRTAGYYAPYGPVPNVGIVVSWGIYTTLTIDYTHINSTTKRVNSAHMIAWLSPKQTSSVGSGTVSGNYKQKSDNGTYGPGINVLSLPGVTTIYPPNSHLYFSRMYSSNAIYYSTATGLLSTAFYNPNASILFDNSGQLSNTVN